ncbi:glycine zipper domain-containing protein [Falsiroseomonas sp.]|uniref:glycine zipper domain-containing protein n=1 Tax=Falsiroseomonas sp. TaxID=2870721 RepID=UPI003561B02D
MHAKRLILMLVVGIGLAGCAGMTEQQQNVGVGALGGGALGGIVGSFGGNAGLGALLGAGVGGVGGYLYDQSLRNR